MILDTNILIRLERELKMGVSGPAIQFLEGLPTGRLCITPTIAGEFGSGVSMADRSLWEEALALYEMLEITPDAAWFYGKIYRDLSKRGKLIGTNDMWIAATALAHRMPVATGNVGEFRRVDGLEVISV